MSVSSQRLRHLSIAVTLGGLLLGCADLEMDDDGALDAQRPSRTTGGYVYQGRGTQADGPEPPPRGPDGPARSDDGDGADGVDDGDGVDDVDAGADDAPGAAPLDAFVGAEPDAFVEPAPPEAQRFDMGPDPEPPPMQGYGDPPPVGIPPPPVICNPINAGLSSVVVNGDVRLFSVQMPANTSRMAILFLWHGFLEWPDIFRNEIVYDVPAGRWVAFDPNAFPMPLMIVTPWDTKMIPPWGLDWDIVSGAVDVPYFDAMLQCIREQYAIDDSRIYSFGFSAGAVFSNLLASIYPDLFAATISESGAWFNDPAQWADVLVPIIQWQWPPLNAAHRGNVLLTHGGPNDFATVISLESANQKALPFLHGHGRTVVECAHTFGHTRAPDLTQRMYYDYMWAHQRGGPALGGLPPGFPTLDRPVGSTRCALHRAR